MRKMDVKRQFDELSCDVKKIEQQFDIVIDQLMDFFEWPTKQMDDVEFALRNLRKKLENWRDEI